MRRGVDLDQRRGAAWRGDCRRVIKGRWRCNPSTYRTDGQPWRWAWADWWSRRPCCSRSSDPPTRCRPSPQQTGPALYRLPYRRLRAAAHAVRARVQDQRLYAERAAPGRRRICRCRRCWKARSPTPRNRCRTAPSRIPMTRNNNFAVRSGQHLHRRPGHRPHRRLHAADLFEPRQPDEGGNGLRVDNTDLRPYTTTVAGVRQRSDAGPHASTTTRRCRIRTTAPSPGAIRTIDRQLAPGQRRQHAVRCRLGWTSFAGKSLGVTAYAWYNEHLYLEAGAYQTMSSWLGKPLRRRRGPITPKGSMPYAPRRL